jgi:hypothetical protein
MLGVAEVEQACREPSAAFEEAKKLAARVQPFRPLSLLRASTDCVINFNLTGFLASSSRTSFGS